jgi:hypothetical protein
MDLFYQCKEVLKIQKFRRMVSYAGFYCFTTLITYAYTSNTYVTCNQITSLFNNFITTLIVQLFSPASTLCLSFSQDKGWDL